ncbi:hypothetical protein DL769_009206 [Monosporascus sp. CRB-8-3]|nr:hypothetical protein DL769_009206 [Monosporascus sp. CRB-8-3]
MKTPEARTADGFELQFGTNHLSHFLLFYLLRDLLLASTTPRFASRVVSVSSAAYRYSPVSKELEGKGGLYLEGACVAGPVPPDGDLIE